MGDEQDRAEMFDAEEMGDDPSVPDELPGEDFPPDRPQGARSDTFAEDGSVVTDSVTTRTTRLEPEDAVEFVQRGVDLVADSDDLDVEAELIGETDDEPTRATTAAEVAAMHLVTDSDREPADEG